MSVANVTITNAGDAEVRVSHVLVGNSCGMGEHVTEARVLKAGESLTFGVLKNSYLQVNQH